MPHCSECGHDWSRDVDIMAERCAALRQRVAVLEEALGDALCWIELELEGQDEDTQHVVDLRKWQKALATTEGE